MTNGQTIVKSLQLFHSGEHSEGDGREEDDNASVHGFTTFYGIVGEKRVCFSRCT